MDCGAILRKYTKNSKQDACSTFKDSLTTADYTEIAIVTNLCASVEDEDNGDWGGETVESL